MVRAGVRFGDHGRGAGLDEACREVVDALPRHVERAFGESWLGVARGVAEVVEQHDRIRREVDALRDRSFAEVLVATVAAASGRVETEAVLARRIELISIATRPAVAVTHVHHDARTLERFADGRPRGVRRVDLGDIRRERAGDGRGLACLGAIAIGRAAGRSHDQDDLGDARLGARGEGSRRHDADGDQSGQECDDHPSHDGLCSTTGIPQRPAVTPRSARPRA